MSFKARVNTGVTKCCLWRSRLFKVGKRSMKVVLGIFKAKISIFNIYLRIFKNKWFLKNIVILLNSHQVFSPSVHSLHVDN